MTTRPDLRLVAVNDRPRRVCDEQWAWFARQTDKAKAKGRKRVLVMWEIAAIVEAGRPKSIAVNFVAARHRISQTTAWSWLRTIRGVRPADWLAYLTPSYATDRRPKEHVDETAYRLVKSLYLHPNGYSWQHSVEMVTERYCRPRRITLPSSKTLLRRLRAECSGNIVRIKRSETLSRRYGVLPEGFKPGIAPDGEPARRSKPRRTSHPAAGGVADAG